MKKRSKNAQRTPSKGRREHKKSSSVRLEITPEQLIEKGDLRGAIESLQEHLKRSPMDDSQRGLLGYCLFEIEHYTEAASTWLSLAEKDAKVFLNVGIAFLNAEQWDQAIAHLEASLQLQKQPKAYFLLAFVLLRGKHWSSPDIETMQIILNHLQSARALPECPAEIYLRLSEVIWSYAFQQHPENDEQENQELDQAREQGLQIIEEGFLLYPDDIKLRLAFAEGLLYRRKQYDTALLTLVPLLQRTDLEGDTTEAAVGLSIQVAMTAGWYEKALTYLDRLPSSSPEHESYDPKIELLRANIHILQGNDEAAHACYNRAVQTGSFPIQFLALFSWALLWLQQEKHMPALPLVERAVTLWWERSNFFDRSYVLDVVPPVSIGSTYFGEESLTECVKQVCEKLLQTEHTLPPVFKGQISYLLYSYYTNYYGEGLRDVTREQKKEYEQLLLQAAQALEHHFLSESLASYYKEKEHENLPQAVKYHLLWNIQSFLHDEDDFDEGNAEFSFDGEEALSQEIRQGLHAEAWILLQSHPSSSLICTVFLPFYRSFWRDILQEGKMHQEIIAVTAFFLGVVAEEDLETEQWDYAYASHLLGQTDEAEQAYRSYLKRHPQQSAVLNNLAIILEGRDLLQEALPLMEKALALESEKEVYVTNCARLKEKLRNVQKFQEATQKTQASQLWALYDDTQKQLLYYIYEYKPSQWSQLLPYLSTPESLLQEQWSAFISHGVLNSQEEQEARIDPSLLPMVRHEGLLLVLFDDVIKSTSPRKKQPWIPVMEEFAPNMTANLNKTQRSAFHKAAFKRLQAAKNRDMLTDTFLPFYRSTWKRILLEGSMAQEIVDVARILTTLPFEEIMPELWDYAFYAHDLHPLAKEAEQAYKRYLEGGASEAAYHNLALLSKRDGHLEAAVDYADQALALMPEKENTQNLKEQLLQEIDRRKKLAETQQRQHENLIRTAPDRWPQLDQFKRRILGTLAALYSFEGFGDFATLVGMEERVLKGHWRKLVEQGMILDEENGPRINPYILDLAHRERTHAVVTRIVHGSSEVLAIPIFKSQQEYKIYSILIEMFPNQLVFPNMALQSIFDHDTMETVLPKNMFWFYMCSSVDFCITLTSTYLPLIAFEVDSVYHDKEEQKARDEKKDEIFRKGGVDLLRVRAYGQLTPQALRYEIIEAVKGWRKAWHNRPQKRGWSIDIEQEVDFGRFGLDEEELQAGESPTAQ